MFLSCKQGNIEIYEYIYVFNRNYYNYPRKKIIIGI